MNEHDCVQLSPESGCRSAKILLQDLWVDGRLGDIGRSPPNPPPPNPPPPNPPPPNLPEAGPPEVALLEDGDE